jgi:hypothetical protein
MIRKFFEIFFSQDERIISNKLKEQWWFGLMILFLWSATIILLFYSCQIENKK